MLDADEARFGFYVQARAVLGGTANYLLFDEETGRFTERSSSTTTLMFSIGVIFYPF